MGVYAALPLGATVALRPELLLTQKGGQVAYASCTSVCRHGTITAALDYLEVPLLVRYAPLPRAVVHPHLYAGPAVALAHRCRADYAGDGAPASVTCFGAQAAAFALERRSATAVGVVGGEFAVGGRGPALGVGVRYERDLSVTRTSSTDHDQVGAVRMHVVTVYGRVDVPMGRR